MATNDIFLLKMNASGDWVQYALTAEAGKVIGFDSSLNPVMMSAGGSSTETFTTGLTSLTIDLTSKGYCDVAISANSTFVLSNITTGKYYTFCVKNTSASTITVSLPSGGVYSSGTADITSGYAREFSMVYDGTKMRWQISELLLNA